MISTPTERPLLGGSCSIAGGCLLVVAASVQVGNLYQHHNYQLLSPKSCCRRHAPQDQPPLWSIRSLQRQAPRPAEPEQFHVRA